MTTPGTPTPRTPTRISGGSGGRGVITFFAIVMTSLIALTLLMLAHAFTAQVRRTHDHAAQAQLHQLLIAGETLALHHLAQHPDFQGEIDLPLPAPLAAPLATESLQLTLLYNPATPNQATLIATSSHHEARELLTLSLTPTGRSITHRELLRTH